MGGAFPQQVSILVNLAIKRLLQRFAGANPVIKDRVRAHQLGEMQCDLSSYCFAVDCSAQHDLATTITLASRPALAVTFAAGA